MVYNISRYGIFFDEKKTLIFVLFLHENTCYEYSLQAPCWDASNEYPEHQGPVVQSVVSLTSSLRVISLTVLADSIYNILIFFAENNVSSFCTAKATHIFFSQKFQHICVSLDVNDVVTFEQLGPVFVRKQEKYYGLHVLSWSYL